MDVRDTEFLPIKIPGEELAEFCGRWDVVELALFGSVLTDNFQPDSDIDVLVAFSPEIPKSLLDLVRMQQELEEIFGRPVDLVERDTIRNPFRRQRILQSHQVVYANER